MENTHPQPSVDVRCLEDEQVHFQVRSGRIREGHIYLCHLYVGYLVGTGTIHVQHRLPEGHFAGHLGFEAELYQNLREALSIEEKRQRPRLSCDLPVRSPQLPGEARTVDISESGIRVRTAERVAVGAVLPLSLALSLKDEWDIHSQVRWCRPASENFDFGGRFVDVEWKPVIHDIHSKLPNTN